MLRGRRLYHCLYCCDVMFSFVTSFCLMSILGFCISVHGGGGVCVGVVCAWLFGVLGLCMFVCECVGLGKDLCTVRVCVCVCVCINHYVCVCLYVLVCVFLYVCECVCRWSAHNTVCERSE